MTKDVYEEIKLEIEDFENGNLEFNECLEMFDWFFDEQGLINLDFCHISSSDYFLEVKKMYPNSINDFAEDVIISLLFDAINGINQYFAKKPKQRRVKWADKYEVIYFKWGSVHEEIKDFEKTKFNNLINKYYDNHKLERQIPKTTLPFSVFSLLTTLYFNGTNLNNLSNKYLGLKSTRSISGTEIDIFRQSFEDHKEFLRALEKFSINDGVNISLTLYQYNLVTNFIDTYLQMFTIENGTNYKKGDFKIRYSNIPILTWKIELIKNNELYSFITNEVGIKK